MPTDPYPWIMRIRNFSFVIHLLISAENANTCRPTTVYGSIGNPHTSRHLPAVAPAVCCLTTVTFNRQTHVDVVIVAQSVIGI